MVVGQQKIVYRTPPLGGIFGGARALLAIRFSLRPTPIWSPPKLN